MSLGTLSSRILGMVRDMVLATLFPKIVTDAFVVAFRLPNLFRRVLGEGSLAASFIPVFVEQMGKDREQASRLASAVMSLLWILTGTISVLGIVFMDTILGVLVSGGGYQSVAGKEELTIFLARIMFSYLFLVTTYAFLMSVANSLKRFFWPAVAPAFFNLIEIIFSFFPAFRELGDQLAWGVIAGGVVQVLVVVFSLRGSGLRIRWTWNWNTPGMRIFLYGLLPSAVGMGVGQILGVVNVYFASRLPQGAHSYIYLADRLLEFPQSLVAVSLGVALLPTLAEHWSSGRKEQMLTTHQEYMRILMAVTLPAAAGLFALAAPIVQAIYGRGQFGSEDVASTAAVTEIYAFILVITGLHRVVAPGFYAIKNTWLPAVLTVVAVVFHVFAADYLTGLYGLRGLVGATALTGLFNLIGLCFFYRVYVGPLALGRLVLSALHLLPAALVMGWASRVIYDVCASALGNIVSLALAVIGGVIIICILARLIRHKESMAVMDKFLRRFTRRMR